MLVLCFSYHICVSKDSLDVSSTLDCFLQLSPVLSVWQPQGIPTCITKGSFTDCSEAQLRRRCLLDCSSAAHTYSTHSRQLLLLFEA